MVVPIPFHILSEKRARLYISILGAQASASAVATLCLPVECLTFRCCSFCKHERRLIDRWNLLRIWDYSDPFALRYQAALRRSWTVLPLSYLVHSTDICRPRRLVRCLWFFR